MMDMDPRVLIEMLTHVLDRRSFRDVCTEYALTENTEDVMVMSLIGVKTLLDLVARQAGEDPRTYLRELAITMAEQIEAEGSDD